MAGKKNTAQAKKLFNEILNSKSPNALVFKALMYETGSGVEKNLMRAKTYYETCTQTAIDLFATMGLSRITKKIAEQELLSRTLLEEETAKASSTQSKEKSAIAPSRTHTLQDVSEKAVLFGQESTTQSRETDFTSTEEVLKNELNQALSYDDGSIITEISTKKDKIVIKNPLDDSMVTILTDKQEPITTQHLKTLKTFTYDDRVKKWFLTVQELRETTREKRERHSFAQRVDEIVQLIGKDAIFFKQDGTLEENKVLDGFITTKDGRMLKGRFEYALYDDQKANQVLYHRFLHPHSKAITD